MELIRKTIENDEEYLRQISTEIDIEKDDYKAIIEKIKEYCKKDAVYALAPVQIGIPKRIIYIKNSSQDMNNNYSDNYDENIIYINPKIISEKGKTIFLEGCASCIYKDHGNVVYYTGLVERPYKIEIEYIDIKGNKKNKSLEGFESTIFCHEYDHLNGVIHLDKSKEIHEMSLEEMKSYRSINPYKIISKD